MSNDDQENKRRAVRMRTLKGAKLVLPNNVSTFDCTVRNISATGALVEMPSTLGVPQRVSLRLDDGSPERVCEVAWRTERRLGLHFVGA